MDVRLVTSNLGKFREVREILDGYGVQVRRVDRRFVEPQSDSLEVVVRAKLDAIPPDSGVYLVDDSGLFIPALGGFPGVYSAHILRIWGYRALPPLLARRSRTAVFRTVAGVRVGRKVVLFTGETSGTIVARPRGRGGFGYDPIFQPRGSRRTYAEMTLEEKNRTSHRAKAFRQVGSFLHSRASSRARRPSPAPRKGTKRTSL